LIRFYRRRRRTSRGEAEERSENQEKSFVVRRGGLLRMTTLAGSSLYSQDDEGAIVEGVAALGEVIHFFENAISESVRR